MTTNDENYIYGWQKLVSIGMAWRERFRSEKIPYTFLPLSITVGLSTAIFLSSAYFVIPSFDLPLKAAKLFAPASVTLSTEKTVTPSDSILFGLSTEAIEQASELEGDLKQALEGLASGQNIAFTEWPSDNKKFAIDKFSLKKATDSAAFIAIPVARFAVYHESSVEPGATQKTKFRNVDGTYSDTPTATSQKMARDSLFFAALRKGEGKWVAYSFKPDHAIYTPEKIKGMREVTQKDIKQTFASAFGANN